MKKFDQLLILGTTLLLSAAALTGCSGSSALGATISDRRLPVKQQLRRQTQGSSCLRDNRFRITV